MIVGKDTNTGWAAWSPQQANDAKKRFETRQLRLVREQQENEARLLAKAHEKFRLIADEPTATQAEMEEKERKKRIIAAAIERANAKKTPQQPQ
jgi:electron transport complex protein RnfB